MRTPQCLRGWMGRKHSPAPRSQPHGWESSFEGIQNQLLQHQTGLFCIFFSFGTTRGARNIWGGEEKYQKATEMPFEAEFKGIYDINTKQVVYVCGSRWGTYVGTQKTEHAIILTPFPQVLKIGTVSTSSTWQQELSMLTRNPTHTILSQHRSFPLYFSIPSVLPSPTMVVSWGTVWQKQPKFLSNTVHIPNELHPSSHTAPTICKQRGLQPLWAFYGKSWRSYCLQHLENTIMLLKIQSFLSYSLGFWCRFLHLGMHKCWYS